MRKRSVFTALVVSLLLGLSPLAAAPMIDRGIDVFTTPDNGRTYYDFAQNPIPAGFFCRDSKAFAGRVAFKGLPLATKVPGQLLDGDTVIERLDDAVFDAKGMAVTRIKFRALSLVSIAPIKTSCGAFHVYVALGGQQRATVMSIHRTQEGGGTFVAPLAVDVRMTFIPVKPPRNKGARKLEIDGKLRLPAHPLPWSFRTGATAEIGMGRRHQWRLDSRCRLPGTSNFAPGWSPITAAGCRSVGAVGQCHAADGEMHCISHPAFPLAHRQQPPSRPVVEG